MRNGILFIFVILLAIFPLLFLKNAEFGGADGQAKEAIIEVAPNYKPWFHAIWQPPSGEIESLLFSLQAAVGAIIIGYCLGYGKARKKYSSTKE
jgi:cobalt/nickel transport protein